MIEVKEISLSDKRGKKKFFKFLIDLYKGNKYAAPIFISTNLQSSTLR